jgi:hypothetical protein
MVLKLTQDRRLRVIAGRPSHCSSVITGNQEEVPNGENGESLASYENFFAKNLKFVF